MTGMTAMTGNKNIKRMKIIRILDIIFMPQKSIKIHSCHKLSQLCCDRVCERGSAIQRTVIAVIPVTRVFSWEHCKTERTASHKEGADILVYKKYILQNVYAIRRIVEQNMWLYVILVTIGYYL